MTRKYVFSLLSCVIVSLAVHCCFGQVLEGRQQTLQISGNVTSHSGAAIPNATITVKNKDTGRTFSAVSDSEGRFRVQDVPPGHYDVKVEVNGFATFRISDLSVTPSQSTSLNIVLDDTQPTITVTVPASVKGSVRNNRNRPIKDAEITIREKDGEETWTISTDGNGKYDKDLPPGKYKILVKADGFRNSDEKTIELRGGAKTVNFRLTPASR